MLPTHHSTNKIQFDSETEDSEIKAPRPRPMESEQFPPEFILQEIDLSSEFNQKLTFCEIVPPAQRRSSLDMQYSIFGFLNKKIKQKGRQRTMSQDICLNPQ